MAGLLVISLGIGASPEALTLARSAGVLMHIMGTPRPAALRLLERSVVEEEEQLDLASGTIRARRFRPEGIAKAPPLVLLHGVHPKSIDEPRQVAFARAMAAAGLDVLSPALPELAKFQITADTLPRITESARHHAKRAGRATAGVIGISFSGGLALVAASQTTVPWASFIVTVGSHHSLERLATYYAGEPISGPTGEHHSDTAHPYGARVIIHAHADHFFASEDVATARALLDRWIANDHQGAKQGIPRLVRPESRAAMAEVLDWDNPAPLAKQILAAVKLERAALAAASPAGKLDGVTVPVFAVHGAYDPIIPSTETRWLAQELPPESVAQAVITPVLRHAEMPGKPKLSAYAELIDFMAGILRAAQ